MKENIRRSIRRGLAACLAVFLLHTPQVMAEEAEPPFTFDLQNYILTAYSGSGGDVLIPSSWQGHPVETLGTRLFYNRSDIASAVVPETCTVISASAFSGCASLTAVSLPEQLAVIAPYAFYSCSSLQEIRIPASVGYIGSGAFAQCESLKTIVFTGDAPSMPGSGVFDGIPADARFIVPENVLVDYMAILPEGAYIESSGENAVSVSYLTEEFDFRADTGEITLYLGFQPIVEIPGEIDGYPVSSLGEGAFRAHRYVYRVILPEGLTEISDQCFENAWVLSDVYFPSTLTRIGSRAFAGLNPDGALGLPLELSEIGDGAFAGMDHPEELVLPASLLRLGEEAFRDTRLQRVVFEGAPAVIGSGAFRDSTLREVICLQPGATDAAPDAFAGCDNWHGDAAAVFGTAGAGENTGDQEITRLPPDDSILPDKEPVKNPGRRTDPTPLSELLEVRYEASVNGEKYSVLFRRDGRAEFSVMSYPVPDLTWHLDTVSLPGGDVQALVVAYYGEDMYFVPEGAGFALFYADLTDVQFLPVE